jgi:hypothetical protein
LPNYRKVKVHHYTMLGLCWWKIGTVCLHSGARGLTFKI